MTEAIEVRNLTKKYGSFIAVNDVSFSVEAGETFGILGPNGAGKTTTLEMIEGLRKITSGEVLVSGHKVTKESRVVKSLIGVQLQASSFFEGLNLKELVATFASLYGRRVDSGAILQSVQLSDKAGAMVKELSGGQKQRLSVAVALVNDPQVLFLDEPTTGLDPQARRNMWELITKIKKQGKTIILTTHYMEEAEVLCDRVAIMDQAKILALGTPQNLIREAKINSAIEFRIEQEADLKLIKNLPGVVNAVRENDDYCLISRDPGPTLSGLFQYTQEYSLKILDMQLRQPTLEDVFLKLTGHSLRE